MLKVFAGFDGLGGFGGFGWFGGFGRFGGFGWEDWIFGVWKFARGKIGTLRATLLYPAIFVLRRLTGLALEPFRAEAYVILLCQAPAVPKTLHEKAHDDMPYE